jgi:Cu+-exporting ATPase
MTLEPLIPEATVDDDNLELRDFSRRFCGPCPDRGGHDARHGGHRFGIMDPAQQSWLEFVLSLPVTWAGWPSSPMLAIADPSQSEHVDLD